MPVLRHIPRLLTCAPGGAQGDVHSIENAAIVWSEGRIEWVGPDDALQKPSQRVPGDDVEFECKGGVVIPGLVDCHTHLAFGGWRADEFSLRCRGATYQEIAAAGGGIRSTMRHTRAADEQQLVDRASGFLHEMTRLGVTTVEAKSGYGLTLEDELKLLRVYRRLGRSSGVQLVSTLLAAHVVPPEYRDRRDEYVALLCDELIPMVASEHLAEYCDVFVEDGAFTRDEARLILAAATRHGLGAKLHVDQLSDGGGARLAAECGATSADHLEYTGADGARAMAAARVVAVALPLATLYLRQKPMDARLFIENGCDVAVATDFNPGSAPSYHLPLAMMLACTMNGLTPGEALKGATVVAAKAIGRDGVSGSIEAGKRVDLVELDVDSVDDWLYHFRANQARRVWCAGHPVTEPRGA